MISSIKISQNISIQSELKPLNSEEKNILRKIRQKKSKFFFSTLAGFILLIPIGYLYSITTRHVGYRSYWELSENTRLMMRRLAPYFYSFLFLLMSGYFTYYYYTLLYPITKDLKQGMKEILYYDPGKYKTPFFEEFYIVTPLLKKTRVKIAREFYNKIEENSLAAISYSVHSHFIFSIELDDQKITFNETNEPVDI